MPVWMSKHQRGFINMKFLLLALFVGLAVAATVKDSAYRPRREYLYHYDTQLLTGQPYTSKIYSGFRLSCNARVQFITYSKIRVALENVVLYRVNEPIMQDHAQQRLLPVELLKELTGLEASTMERFLTIPFGFEYSKGIVLSVALPDEDVEWSVNVKRAFISLFQMNLSKRMLLQESTSATDVKGRHGLDWYNVVEQSALGDCVTLYTVSPTLQSRTLYVTKTRDFKRCVDQPTYFKSIFENQEKSSFLKDDPLLQEANMKYSIKGNTDKFIILSAVSEGRILFSPYKNEGQIMTSVNQTLYLRSSKSLDHTSTIPEIQPGKHKKNTLRMTLPTEAVDAQDPFRLTEKEPKQLNQPADVYTIKKITLHLKLAAEDTIRLTSEQALSHLRIAIDMLRTSPEPIIKALWTQLSTQKPVDDVTLLSVEILWKILPTIATDAAANVVLDICNKEFLMTHNCTMALHKLALRATPTTKLISKLITLTENRLKRLYPSVKQAAYLALGSLGYKMNVAKMISLQEIDRSEEILNQVTRDSMKEIRHLYREIKRKLENQRHKIINIYSTTEETIIKALKKLLKSSIFEDKVLALKSMGNSGMQDAIPTLMKYLSNTAEPHILRVMAITAFRRMWYPEEARKEAISILRRKVLDVTERSDVRNLAFETMAGLRPELPVYEAISDSLRTEKDKHVSSFILSYFKTHANSTYSPHWELKKNCTAALLLAPRERTEDNSIFAQMSSFSEDYKLGGAWKVSSIGDSFGYRGAALSLETYIAGYLSEFAEIGVNTEGLSAVLEKLVGPRGLISNKKSLFDLLKRAPRDISPAEMIDRIFKSLKIKPRTMPIPYAHIYFKLMGHELKFWDFTTALRHLTTEGKMPVKIDQETLSIGLPIDLNTMYDHFESQMTLPTEAGIPISLKFQSLSTVDVKGNLEFKVGPYLLEEDRQGRPPVSVISSIDLKPKMVFGIRGSMGIDMFYYKPVVGFFGLIKAQTPLNLVLGIDTVYSKIKIVNYMKTLEEPLLEFLIEPFSQFAVIPVEDENPVLLQHSQQMFAPYGSRVRPISNLIPLNVIGYNLALTGQAPTYLSIRNVLMPLNGRTLFNVFLKPMRDAPKQITFAAQLIYPDEKATISPDYIKTYQEARSENDEDRDTEAPRYDKDGRPYPKRLDDILPYRDPVDLDKTTITMRQLASKFQKVSGKSMPFYNFDDAIAVVMTFDASSQTKRRQYQMETAWASLFHYQYNMLLTRLWRNSIPNEDPDSWQAFIENILAFPMDVFEPKDVFDPRKQAEIMNELQYLITLNSHKVINQIMNVTVMSVGEQFNYPSMLTVPAYKVIESLAPEQLYKLMNITGAKIYNRQWIYYWEKLFPLYHRVSEERRTVVDRFYVKREVPIVEQLDLILKIQNEFLADIEDIISKGFIAHAEMPILQLINTYQMKTVYMLELNIEKAEVKGLIDHVDYVQGKLNKALANVDLITQKVTTLRNTVSAVAQDVDSNINVIFQPPILTNRNRQPKYFQADKVSDLKQQYQPYSEGFGSRPTATYESDNEDSSDYYTTSPQNTEWTLNQLRSSLFNLTLDQLQAIKEVETALYNEASLDYRTLKYLSLQVKENITLIDQVLRLQPVLDPVTKETIMLITVQNEMLVVLLEKWEKVYNDKHRPEGQTHPVPNLIERFLVQYKVHGNFLAERSAYLYRSVLLRRVVLPYLTAPEVRIFRDIDQLVRQLSPQIRDFNIYMAYNITSMRNPETIRVVYNKYITDMDQWMEKALEIQKDLNSLPETPKVYLVSELLDTFEFMKRMVEFARGSLESLQDTQRLGLIEKLNKQATGIQTIVATMSPIFTKYNYAGTDLLREFKTTLSTIPVNMRLLDVQDAILQQNVLLDQIREYLQNPDVSNTVLSNVLRAAVDRCEVLQETLKENHEEVLLALGDALYNQRESISGIYTQALNQQYVLYAAIRNTIKNHRDRLTDVAQQESRISNLELDLTDMANDKDNKMTSLKIKDEAEASQAEEYDRDVEDKYSYENDDSYVAEKVSETVRRPVNSKVRDLQGIRGFFNISWGPKELFNKNFQVELLASRTIEQMLYIFKQMNTILRSSDVSSAINHRLSGELWKNEDVMKKLNSYNHLHLVANYDEKTLPRWTKRWANYLRDYLKVRFWDQYTQQEAMPFIEKEEVHAMLDISDFNKQWDLYVMSNSETDKFIGVPQHRFFPMSPLSENLRLSYPHPQVYNKRCVLNKDKLYTMDKVSYLLPEHMERCRTLLAMDCTQEKAFAVTIIKSNSSYEGNILQILTPEKEIEIIPGYLDVQVRINGKFLLLKDNVPVTYKKEVHYDENRKTIVIRRQGLRVEVELPLTGLYLIVEGGYVRMEVSSLYKKKLCGLCSNYDDQMSWEFEGPSQEIFTTARPFVYSYILREGQCPINRDAITKPELDLNGPPAHPDYSRQSDRYDDIMRPFRPKGSSGKIDKDDDEDSDPVIERDECQPEQETSIRKHRRRNQICISEKPIKKCPLDCSRAVETKKEKVKFVCINEGDSQVDEIRKAASHGPVDIQQVSRQIRAFRASETHELRCQQPDAGDDI